VDGLLGSRSESGLVRAEIDNAGGPRPTRSFGEARPYAAQDATLTAGNASTVAFGQDSGHAMGGHFTCRTWACAFTSQVEFRLAVNVPLDISSCARPSARTAPCSGQSSRAEAHGIFSNFDGNSWKAGGGAACVEGFKPCVSA
jgi:hypothetical protein